MAAGPSSSSRSTPPPATCSCALVTPVLLRLLPRNLLLPFSASRSPPPSPSPSLVPPRQIHLSAENQVFPFMLLRKDSLPSYTNYLLGNLTATLVRPTIPQPPLPSSRPGSLFASSTPRRASTSSASATRPLTLVVILPPSKSSTLSRCHPYLPSSLSHHPACFPLIRSRLSAPTIASVAAFALLTVSASAPHLSSPRIAALVVSPSPRSSSSSPSPSPQQ